MKPKGSLLPLLCVLFALMPTAAATAAESKKLIIPPSFSIEATLPKSDGFSFTVYAIGHKQISVSAYRKGKGEFATYSVPGKASRHGFSADFGRFGRMQMRFEGTVSRVADSKGCKGPAAQRGTGTFEGHLTFRGREDFASIRAVRVRGRYQRSFRQVCDQSGSELAVVTLGIKGRDGLSAPAKISGDVLEAESHAEGLVTSFSAIELDRFKMHPLVFASAFEKVGRVRLSALTQPRDDEGSLIFGAHGVDPETASVRPGAPFTGEGSYAKTKDGPVQWTGDLRVPLAGYGTVALTGPDFQAHFCHADLQSFRRCDG
ncbi:MAG TPA: hypothetical protein VFJ53_04200 [Solirubrobacterales bacterium]|nr:hypothetical protein [Solirubrobacterales bacterium]